MLRPGSCSCCLSVSPGLSGAGWVSLQLVNIHGKLTRYGVVVAYRTLHRFAVQRCGFGSRRWTVLFSIYVVVPRLGADQHGGEVVEAVGDLECVVPALFIHQECQEGNHAGEEDGNEGR